MATVQSIDYNPSYPKRDKRILSLSSRGLKLLTGRITTEGPIFGSAEMPITLAKLGLKKPPMFFEAFGGPNYASQGQVSHRLQFKTQTIPYLAYSLKMWQMVAANQALAASFTGQAVGGNASHSLGLQTGIGEVSVHAKSVNGSLRAILVADLTAFPGTDYVDLSAGLGFIRVFHDVNASNHAPLVAGEEIDGAVHFLDEGQGFNYLYLCDSMGNVYPMTNNSTDEVKLNVAAKQLMAVDENTGYSLASDISFSEFGKTPVGSITGSINAVPAVYQALPVTGNVDGWAFDFMAIGK